ncbi:hypothetical protein CIHG_04948 [Coccidioides immitis H538.4]|uniref:Uncharacterized protein n=3 Tax=Coccidioides immitis TaxID=5501 RepID=A0A0J8U2F6_COCIT|nr:hypothetical protein CIRG_05457 [Coccidioides immitis RMSCC 2394]KMU80817.1 hypothetical protein CISG_08942 [Coccidioides immitis RMSCC 3703]KMU87008.1 hypothetical protein CIHG_04948 [Coccidioides immitis H538.4]
MSRFDALFSIFSIAIPRQTNYIGPNGTSLLITVRGELCVSHHYFSSGSKKTGSSIREQRIHIDRHLSPPPVTSPRAKRRANPEELFLPDWPGSIGKRRVSQTRGHLSGSVQCA